jgi:hypothetical protein
VTPIIPVNALFVSVYPGHGGNLFSIISKISDAVQLRAVFVEHMEIMKRVNTY